MYRRPEDIIKDRAVVESNNEESTAVETNDGVSSFLVGVALIVGVTVLAYIISLISSGRFTLWFWGLGVIGLIGIGKGLLNGLFYKEGSGNVLGKLKRLAIFIAGLLIVAGCAVWGWNTFNGPDMPPTTDVQWSHSTGELIGSNDGANWVELAGTIRNGNKEWN